jgi:hypothetical protein
MSSIEMISDVSYLQPVPSKAAYPQEWSGESKDIVHPFCHKNVDI